jgi:hypothetical protein
VKVFDGVFGRIFGDVFCFIVLCVVIASVSVGISCQDNRFIQFNAGILQLPGAFYLLMFIVFLIQLMEIRIIVRF